MISETACIVEKWIDEYIEALQSNDSVIRRNVKTLITTNQVKPREAKQIATHFSSLLAEIDAVLDRVDADLVEGWSYLNTTKLRRLRSYLEVIVNEFTTKGTVKRRKRKVKPEQLIKSLKYLDNFDGIGESVNPIQIIGAKKVLLYNTKQRKISLYSSETGLTVKGSTLKNFDFGIVKSCGRKENSWIKLISSCPVGRMMNEINNLRAKEQDPTGRINKDTLILRITK
jgi:hypothetical protein|tara:strand:- start:19241 stop:19924 length:684 start_codon:yes stop_codon:yes gene_type:complete